MSDLVSYGFLTPPAVLILLSLVGALLALRWRRFGNAIVILSSMALYALATPFVASWLLHNIEIGIPDNTDLSTAQAIIVLGAGVHLGDGASAPDTLGPLSLERVVYAAEAYRKLHLPVAVSGGRIFPARTAEAALMRAALERDFDVPVTWSDDQSRTTYENALYTARLLSPDHIASVIIVTHAWHLPRALWAFERSGLHALPWPVPRDFVRLQRIDDVLPSIAALHDSAHALHELIGLIYYRLRY
jgi:uncharacterized SAM-binding protein YcdF (DUF218 family)